MAEHELNRAPLSLFSQAKPIEGLVALGLLFILLSAAVAGITIALVNQDWLTLWRTLFFGLLLGWLLAILRKPFWLSLILVVVAGLLYTLLFPGGMVGKIANTALELGELWPGIWNSLGDDKPDLTPLARPLQELLASTWTILTRVQVWGANLLAAEPNADPVPASLTWNVLIWLVAGWAGWVLEFRKDALLAALPAILLSLETLSYSHRRPFAIYLMLGALLLLLAVVQQRRRRQSWNDADMAYPAKKGRQIIRAALLLSIGFVIFSALASSFSMQRIQRWIAERQRSAQQENELAESLGIAPGGTAVPDAFTDMRSPGLPQSHLIGSGPELSRRVVMTVAVQNLGSLPGPLYWRAFTYDVYAGDGWRSSTTEQRPYSADQLIQEINRRRHLLVQQQVYPAEDQGGVVYTAGEPLTVDSQSEAAWRSNGDLFGVHIDRSAAYSAESLVPLVDERALRRAGQRYPEWVRERYLSLPASVPDRVRALAIELTAGEPSPYERARAIENYLRSFPYTLDVSRPPVGRDVVDYFLFDLKTGYCDYYASSMVVLARAAGIPARLVVGYASGTYNLNSGRYVVTEADAHSWVEVYFPGIGWVTFEPTGGRPPLNREELPLPTQSPDSPPPLTVEDDAKPGAWSFVAGAIALAGLAILTWAAIREIHLNRLAESAMAVEVYRRMKRYGKSVDVASGPDDTPYEFSTALRGRLQSLDLGKREPAFFPQLIVELETISEAIVNALYRPSVPGARTELRLLQSWRRLSWKLWLVWLLKLRKSLTGHLLEK